MRYLLRYELGPHADPVRLRGLFDAHREHWAGFRADGTLAAIGPMEDPGDGALGVFTSREAAERFAAADPFVTSGLVARWTVSGWREALLDVRDAEKATLKNYLQRGRDAMLWKLDGLSPYDARRPLVPTGNNLLGLVKHLAGCELGYFGTVFGREPDAAPAWFFSDPPEDDPNLDMYADAGETVAGIVAFYHAAWAHADATIDALPLDAEGSVPWWPPERRTVSLHQVLVHMIAETHRHAGHADLLRELVDGSAGLRPDVSNLPDVGPEWWPGYVARLEQLARHAEG
jgi:uncharacterized protein YciI